MPGISQVRTPEWVPCPSPGELSDPGIEPASLAWRADSLPLSPILTSVFTLPSRFSGVAGVPELQDLKRTAELRSRLRNVSEAGLMGGQEQS